MSRRPRRNHSAVFKAKVAIAAIKGDRTIAQLAEQFDVQAAPKRCRWRGATFEMIRRVFVKVAVRVEELKGRIKLAFPATYPRQRCSPP